MGDRSFRYFFRQPARQLDTLSSMFSQISQLVTLLESCCTASFKMIICVAVSTLAVLPCDGQMDRQNCYSAVRWQQVSFDNWMKCSFVLIHSDCCQEL